VPSELQQNRYDQLIRRVGGIVGPGSKVSEALTELFPIIDVETLKAELQVLSGTHLAFGGVRTPAVAAQFSSLQLFNPAGSGLILTLTEVRLSTSTASEVRIAFESATRGALALNGLFGDSRLGITPLATGQVFFANNVALTPNQGRVKCNANVDETIIYNPNGNWVIAEGTGLTFGMETANGLLQGNFLWRERVAEKSELNF